MMRSLERIAYAVFCGALAFFMSGGLFALFQWLLRMDVFAFSSLTLFYLFSMMAALLGGMLVGAVGYTLCAERGARIGRRAYLAALASGPLVSGLIRIGFGLMERPERAPFMQRQPQTPAETWDWLSQMSAYRPPPHGRAWWMALALSLSLALLLFAQPYLVRRTCTLPPQKISTSGGKP